MNILSWQFLLFVFLTIILYYAVPKKYRWVPLIISSIVFYTLLATWRISFIFFSIIQTFLLSLLIEHTGKTVTKRFILILSVLLNLSILFVYKYLDFFGLSIGQLFGANYKPLNLIAFIGLSFYTFTLIGYSVDVYRGKVKADKNIARFTLFVVYFPRIMQGPIGFYDEDAQKIYDCNSFDQHSFMSGVFKITTGLVKKVLISNVLATFTASAYQGYLDVDGAILLLATGLYFIELYMDFSGFIDIMLGISSLFGIELNENFNSPYLSTSVSDFWRRWHISLSKWFTRYIYIPLGGSRKGMVRLCINILIVFLISGLWHGASWNFVIWGLMHATCQIIGKLTISTRNKVWDKVGVSEDSKILITLRRIVTMVIVGLIWVPFFSPSFAATWVIYQKIFSNITFSHFADNTISSLGLTLEVLLVSSVAIVFLIFFKKLLFEYKLNSLYLIQTTVISAIAISAVVICILASKSNIGYSSDFIYFQF